MIGRDVSPCAVVVWDDEDRGVNTDEVQVLGSVWQNYGSPLDVNDDGQISPLDALLVINEINQRHFSASDGRLPAEQPIADGGYFDTNGDNFAAAIDALLVINSLNRGARERFKN